MKGKIDIVVVSLFDGLSGGRLATDRVEHLNVVRYYSSEVDKYAIQIADKNYPQDTPYRLGDVTKIDFEALLKEIRAEFGNIKIMLLGGSPCQGFSMAGKLKGSSTACGKEVTTFEHYLTLKEMDFEFDGQSYLFWEYIRAMKILQPDYFVLENVRVTKKWLPMFNEAMGVEPTRINSSLLSAQNRDRYYWHNFGEIPQPENKGILLRDILETTPDWNKATILGRRLDERGKRQDNNKEIPITQCLEVRASNTDKSGCITTVQKDNVLSPLPVGRYPDVYGKIKLEGIKPSVAKNIIEQQDEIKAGKNGFHQLRCESGFQDNKVGVDKSPALRDGNSCTYAEVKPKVLVDIVTKQGKEVHRSNTDKSHCLMARDWKGFGNQGMTGIKKEGEATYRKLTPLECERLQTLPDGYTEGVSNSQRYKMIGNGWTIEVVAHILSHIKNKTN